MIIPGRKYSANSSSSYRYSINGQEKERELNENVTTALYWEYDSRIVRRWNTDPVLKPWESPYSCFSNSPIVRVDPNGDDDYFDAKGKYLGSDKKGTAVRIITNPISEIKNLYSKDGATINKAIAQKNSQILSTFVKGNDPKDFDNKTILLNGVLNHYAKDAGIKGEIKPGMNKDDNVPAFTVGESDTRYNVLYGYHSGDGKVLDNYNNIINTLYHEKLHQDDDRNNKKIESFADHAQTYINQFTHSSFKGMSKDAQIGFISSAMDFILNEQYSTTDYSSGNSTITNGLIDRLNAAIKSQGYQVTGGGITSLNLYKDKKLVATVPMTQKKDPN